MKKIRTLSIIGLIAVSSVFLLGFKDYYYRINKSFDIFGAAFRELNSHYVEEIDPEEVVERAISGMVEDLDPYTYFLDKADEKDFDNLTDGSYVGVGISVGVIDSSLTVTGIREGYSAHKKGLRIGDRIYKIDSSLVLNQDGDYLSQFTEGAPGSFLNMKVIRGARGDTLDFLLMREKIDVNTVTYSGFVSDSIAYIKLERFGQKSAYEVKSALNKMKDQGMKALILDLRNDPGGVLQAAVDISSLFLPSGTLVVAARGRDPSNDREYVTKGDPAFPDLPIVALINEYSASASEAVAGALQDLDRAVIAGQNSFGKGLVQSIYPLPHDRAIKITTAKYYTPLGRCVQKEDYFDSEKDEDAEPREFATASGRVLYEADGIAPDTTFPEEERSEIVAELIYSGAIFKYVSLVTADMDSIPSDFKVSDRDFQQFVDAIQSGEVKFDSYLEEKSTELAEISKDSITSGKIYDLVEFLKKDKIEKIKNTRKEIKEVLTSEFLLRFSAGDYYTEHELKSDGFVIKAIDLINSGKYREILRVESKSELDE